MNITNQPISVSRLMQENVHQDCGGIVCFEGVVRNHHEGRAVDRLFYEAYIPMAEKVMQRLMDQISAKWQGCQLKALHRIGPLEIGEAAVAIVAWAPHRKEAFLACEEMINRIKKEVPIWKQEFYSDGSSAWVRCHHSHG